MFHARNINNFLLSQDYAILYMLCHQHVSSNSVLFIFVGVHVSTYIIYVTDVRIGLLTRKDCSSTYIYVTNVRSFKYENERIYISC
jgi:hypothetical protein